MPFATKIISRFFFLILALRNSILNGFLCFQKMARAMGTISVPNFANVLLGKFDTTDTYPYLLSRIYSW